MLHKREKKVVEPNKHSAHWRLRQLQNSVVAFLLPATESFYVSNNVKKKDLIATFYSLRSNFNIFRG